MPRRYSILATLALLSAAAVIVPGEARAQCMPDNLDSAPCCTPINNLALPVFPPIGGSSKFVCFRDCAIQLNQNLCVNIAAPRPAQAAGALVCGVYTINFKVVTCGGGAQVLWQGTMRAQYSRNWQEAGTAGAVLGVWRFLLNGDLKAATALTTNPGWASPNVQPGCYSTFQRIYVSGYIDYAFDCGTNTWTAAWALNHDCDANHHPVGSPRAGGAFHPTRSWTFVGPGAGFVVDPVGTITAAGGSGGEAFRWNDWSTIPQICRAEEPNNGVLNSQGSFCTCNSVGLAQYDDTLFSIAGFCGSTMRTLLPPAPQLRQKRIGRWTNPLVFPGLEEMSLDMGDVDYLNACTTNTSIEFMEGVSTVGGFPAVQYTGVALGTQFVDLGSSNQSPTNMTRRVGVPHITQYIANIDLP